MKSLCLLIIGFIGLNCSIISVSASTMISLNQHIKIDKSTSEQSIIESNSATWDVMNYLGNVKSIVLTEDGKYLWEGTGGGLKFQDAETGEIIKTFTCSNGMPESHAEALLPDGSDGLWIASLGGLIHFDGNETWQVYNQTNSDLPSNSLGRSPNALASDKKGGLWIATTGGLAHFDGKSEWQVFTTKNSDLPHNNVQNVMFDEQTGVWVGTWGGGLARYDIHSDEWQTFNDNESGLPYTIIGSILSDENGGVWVSPLSSGAIFHFDGDTWTGFDGIPQLDKSWARDLMLDENGGVWAALYGSDAEGGIKDGGLLHIHTDGTWQIYNTENSELPANTLNTLVPDNNGGFWIGTWKRGTLEGGAVHFDGVANWHKLNDSDALALPDNYVYTFLHDGANGIWMGTMAGLAHYRANGQWEVFNQENSAFWDSDGVTTLVPDGRGGFFAGAGDGFSGEYASLVRCPSIENCWEMTLIDTLSSYRISSMLVDGTKGLWVGSGSSLQYYLADRPNQGEYAPGEMDMRNYWVRALLSDGEGGFWAGTHYGLLHYTGPWHTGEWDHNLKTRNSDLPSNVINSLIHDHADGLWIGTDNGIVRLKPGIRMGPIQTFNEWTLLRDLDAGYPNALTSVSSLMSDGNEGFWAGGGTNSFWSNRGDKTTLTGATFTHYDGFGNWQTFDGSNSGLPPTVVLSFLPDNSGGFWIGTLSGMAHIALFGSPCHVMKEEADIHLDWFLHRSPVEHLNVQYIELQRAIAKNSPYETVVDSDGNPIRFEVDYLQCQDPRADDCWPEIIGHSPATKIEGDITYKGYTLDVPVVDREWLEGVPRYYRLSAVIHKNDQWMRAANHQEAVLVTPSLLEKPRISVFLERNAAALLPGDTISVGIFVASLDLFHGDVTLELDLPANWTASLEKTNLTLNPGEIKSTLLHVTAPEDIRYSEIQISISPYSKTSNTSSLYGTSGTILLKSGVSSLVAMGIDQSEKRCRVMEDMTVSGNILPVRKGQAVTITGNHIDTRILQTDENGFFQGVVTPQSAGSLRLTAQINGSTESSAVADTFILPATTYLSLTSDINQTMSKGDSLHIQGVMTPVRLDATPGHMDIRFIDPDDQSGNRKTLLADTIVIDEKGSFSKAMTVPEDGFINVKVTLPETSDYLGVSQNLMIPIGQPIGEGIVVVSEFGDANFKTVSKTLGKYVCTTLQNRNIPRERIHYLGLSDDSVSADGNADKKALQYALTEWAVEMISSESPFDTPLNLYLIGELEENGFRLNTSETLTADELGAFLDEAENLIYQGRSDLSAKGLPVTVILEGTRSGEWIETISGKGRIILTSSSAEPMDQGGYAGYDNLGESSFSRYFYQFINYGSDIEGSFAEANYEILKFYRHTQRPVMDADGDGVGTTKYDWYEASGKFIEYRPSGNLRPTIRTTHPDMSITGRENNTLWAIATDPEQEMKGVFCAITDPSDRTRHFELSTIDDSANWYEVKLENFSQTGCHQVVYYAKDNAGNVSLPVERFLHVTASALRPDDDSFPPPVLTLTTEEGSWVTLAWSEASGADGYTLLYAPYPDATSIGRIDMGTQRELGPFDGTGMAFYVAIQARNGSGESELSNIEWFDLMSIIP